MKKALEESVKSRFNKLARRNLDEVQQYEKYTEDDQKTWRLLWENQTRQLEYIAHRAFFKGLKKLGITGDKIPVFSEINRRLKKLTGWQIYICDGTLDDDILYYGLMKKMFPVTNFFRSLKDWQYTPAPDMFHEVFGHLPMLTLKKYGECLQMFGIVAKRYNFSPEVMKLLPPAFWFLVEFILVRGHGDRRIAGPGILSSVGETLYAATSSKPTIHSCGDSPLAMKNFIRQAMYTEYDITKLQIEYFQVESFDLYYKMITKYLPKVAEEIVSHSDSVSK